MSSFMYDVCEQYIIYKNGKRVCMQSQGHGSNEEKALLQYLTTMTNMGIDLKLDKNKYTAKRATREEC